MRPLCLLAGALVASVANAQNSTDAVSLTVSRSQKFQTVDGFGFCEAFQRAHAIYNLPPAKQTQVLDLLFNTTSGAGFSILRVGLGSSPNSTADHMNSIEPAPPPAGLLPDAEPRYVWDRNDSNQVWVAKKALTYGVNMVYADAWSAPGYMKTNGQDDQGGWLCGVRGKTCASGSWIKAYSDYLVQYVKYYLSEGIPVRYLGFVNEPNLVKPYATMLSDGYQAADVIGPLHASLEAANLSSTVGIACCEGQGWSMQRDLTAEVQAAGAEHLTSLVTTHAYKGTPAEPDRPLNTTLKVWITENSPIMKRLGTGKSWYATGEENEGLTYANNLHTAFVTGNISAYIYWIGAGPSNREVPLVWIPQRNDTTPADEPWFVPAVNYWVFVHWSRFIRPGAVRLGLGLGDAGEVLGRPLRASAFINSDGSVVVHIVNNGDDTVPLDLEIPKLNSRQLMRREVYLTDNSHNATQVELNRGLVWGTSLIPPRSLVTFVARFRWSTEA